MTPLTEFLCGNSKKRKQILAQLMLGYSSRFFSSERRGEALNKALTTYNQLLVTWLYYTTAIIAFEDAKSIVFKDYKYRVFSTLLNLKFCVDSLSVKAAKFL